MFGHGRGSLWFCGGVDIELGDLGAAWLLRLRALVFQHAAVDPVPDEISVFFGELVSTRRHEWFQGMRDRSVEDRGGAFTGIGDFSSGSSGHNS